MRACVAVCECARSGRQSEPLRSETMNQRTPAEARRTLQILQRVMLVIGVLYLGLHLWVSLAAYRSDGALASAATLLTLGFGDLYWSVYGAEASTTQPALVAAVMAFASWLSRPWTRPYLVRLAFDSIDDESHASGQGAQARQPGGRTPLESGQPEGERREGLAHEAPRGAGVEANGTSGAGAETSGKR